MTTPPPTAETPLVPSPPRGAIGRRRACARLGAILAGLVAGPGFGATPAGAAPWTWDGAPARQVVIIGVEAIPGSAVMDPKIAPVVQAQLRRLRPNHGFRLVRIRGERVTAGQTVRCELDGGFVAAARLSNPLDANGKVQMHFNLLQAGESQFQTIVASPPDQFNFFDKALPDGNRLIVGIGAR